MSVSTATDKIFCLYQSGPKGTVFVFSLTEKILNKGSLKKSSKISYIAQNDTVLYVSLNYDFDYKTITLKTIASRRPLWFGYFKINIFENNLNVFSVWQLSLRRSINSEQSFSRWNEKKQSKCEKKTAVKSSPKQSNVLKLCILKNWRKTSMKIGDANQYVMNK